MNHTTVNSTLLSCGFAILPLNPAKIFRVLHALFTVKIAVNALTCPLIILLNILLIVAVKSKRHLRNKSNTALACLATTDLMVGLVVQPLHIVSEGLLLKGEANTYCSLTDLAETITIKCCMASFHHLLLISAERYIAIKHTFQYENLVTEVRIIVASCVAWVAAILVPLEDALMTEKDFVKRIRHFRVAFIQLLSRKTVAQAEELERKIFGPKQIGVMATVEQRQNNASRDENEQQGNGKLNIEQETAM
ncbi:hypothetical protein ACROYT_G001827 [Oculina patagonica]